MDLQPRSVGELLSDALALLRRHLGRIALVALPFCALELVLRDAMFSLFPVLMKGVTPDAPLDEATAMLARVTTSGAVLGFALAVVSWMLTLATATMTAGALFHQALEPTDVLRGTLKHTGRVALTALLWFLSLLLLGVVLPTAVVGGLVFVTMSPLVLALSAIAGVVWFAVVMIGLGLRWALWPQAIALEGLAPVKALRRSTALMGPPGVRLSQNPKFRLSLLMLVYFAVQSAVQQLFMLPTMIEGFSQTPPFSGDTSLWSMPLYFGVPLALFQVVTNSVLLPLSGVLTTLFYFDVRVRYEGYDLEIGSGEGAA